MRSILSLPVLITAIGLFTSQSRADEPKEDLTKLQGSWTAKTGPNKDMPLTLAIKGNACELSWDEHKGVVIKVQGAFKIDEKATPKTLDIKFIGPDGQVDPEETLTIYKLDGDTWTLCSGGAGKARPTKFEAAETGFPKLFVLTRVKEKAEEKPINGDLAKFQGAWLAPAGPNDEVMITMTVEANNYTARWDAGDGTKVEIKGEVRVNEKATPQKTIDFFHSQRNDGEDARDNIGIYEFDGDKIKVCVGGAGNERPTEFKKGENGPPLLLTFTKKKD